MCDPVLRDEFASVAPVVAYGLLEPLFVEIGMVRDDDLEVGGELSGDVVNQAEEAGDGCPVGVIFQGSGCLVDLGAEPDLSGLVQHEDARDRPVLAGEVAVQGEVKDDVIADPVLAAADPEQRCGALLGVGDDSQAVEVKADALSAVFKLESVGPVRHVLADRDEA